MSDSNMSNLKRARSLTSPPPLFNPRKFQTKDPTVQRQCEKHKLKNPERIAISMDNEFARKKSSTCLKVDLFNWEGAGFPPASSSSESEHDEEIIKPRTEFVATGIWRKLPNWQKDKVFMLSDPWQPGKSIKVSRKGTWRFHPRKSKSCYARIENYLGKSLGKIKIGNEFKIPKYQPATDTDPLAGVVKPRFVYRTVSESDLSEDREIPVVQIQDGAIIETEFRVWRLNAPDREVPPDEEVDDVNVSEIIPLETFNELQGYMKPRGPITLEEFKEKLMESLKLTTFPEILEQLFMKIDIFDTSRISWDDFSDYFQQEYAEKAETAYSTPPIALYPPATLFDTPNRSPVTRAFVLQDGGTLLFSEDGIVTLWTPDFQPRIWRALGRAAALKNRYVVDKKKPKWYTDMIHVPYLKKLVVPTGDRELQFYDSTSYDPYCQITHVGIIPIHTDAKMKENSLVIGMGDVTGLLYILFLEDAVTILRFCSQQKRINNIPTIRLDAAICHGMRLHKYKVHNDLISQIIYCPTLDRIFTSSLDPYRSLMYGKVSTVENATVNMKNLTNRFTLGYTDFKWKPKPRKREDEVRFPIGDGVRTFDVWESKRIVAAAGLDRFIWIWNIYVPMEPLAKMRGHNAAIVHLSFDRKSESLFSIDSEKTVMIWSINTSTIINVYENKKLGIRAPTIYCFHPCSECLLVETSEFSHAIKLKRRGDDGLPVGVTHYDAITAIVYNPHHDFIITCSSEDILVWKAESGELVAEFNTIGGDGNMHLDTIKANLEGTGDNDHLYVSPIPLVLGRELVDTYNVGNVVCAAIDGRGKRFFTAHENGCIKAWNFYNGRNLYNLYKPLDNQVICDMHYMTLNEEHRYLVTVGWDRKVSVYVDNMTPEVVHQITVPQEPIEFEHKSRGHKDDIWAMSYGYPNIIASGDYSGRLLIWNINSAHLMASLRANRCRDRINFKEKFIASLCFHQSIGSKNNVQYLISSGPYHLLHIWRASNTRDLSVGSVGWVRPCSVVRDYITCIKSSKSNNLVVCADTNGGVSIWKVEDRLGVKDPVTWFPRSVLNKFGGKDKRGFRPPGNNPLTTTYRHVNKATIRNNEAEELQSTIVSNELILEDDKNLKKPEKKKRRKRKDELKEFGKINSLKRSVSKAANNLEFIDEETRELIEWYHKDNPHLRRESYMNNSQTGRASIMTVANNKLVLRPKKSKGRRASRKTLTKSYLKSEINLLLSRKKPPLRQKGYGLGPVQLKLVNEWKCHEMAFAALEIVESFGLIVTGGRDQSVRIWDFQGRHVGILGQPHTWLIGDPSSYAEHHPSDVMLDLKRVRAMEFFRAPPPEPLQIEVDTADRTREILEKTTRHKLTNKDVSVLVKKYRNLNSRNAVHRNASLLRKMPSRVLSVMCPQIETSEKDINFNPDSETYLYCQFLKEEAARELRNRDSKTRMEAYKGRVRAAEEEGLDNK